MSSRRRVVGAGLAVIVLAVLVVVGLRSPVARNLGLGGGVDQNAPGPVLLVTGYGGGEDALRSLADRLQRAGREAQVVPAVDGGTGDLGHQADALDSAVTAVLDRGAPSVDLVGFSAGGVVVRLWVRDHEGTHKA